LTIITEVPRSSKTPQTLANQPQRTFFLSFLEIADWLTSSVYKSLVTLCLEAHISLNANFTERKGRVYLYSRSFPRRKKSLDKKWSTHIYIHLPPPSLLRVIVISRSALTFLFRVLWLYFWCIGYVGRRELYEYIYHWMRACWMYEKRLHLHFRRPCWKVFGGYVHLTTRRALTWIKLPTKRNSSACMCDLESVKIVKLI